MLLRVLVGVGVASLLLCGGCLTRLWILSDPRTQITIGPDTTSIEGPLTPEGYVDYLRAFTDRASAGVTNENNAAVLLALFDGLQDSGDEYRRPYFRALGVSPAEADESRYISMKDYLRAQGTEESQFDIRLGVLQSALSRTASEPWAVADDPDFAAYLAANEASLALLVKAAGRTRYFSPVVPYDPDTTPLCYVLLPLENNARNAVSMLAARAMLRAGEGEMEGAWNDLLACHRLGRLMSQSQFLIVSIIALNLDRQVCAATEAFAAGDACTGDQLRRCLQDLDALPPCQPFAPRIDTGLRWMLLDQAQWIARGRFELSDNPDVADTDRRTSLNAAVDWDETLRVINEYCDRAMTAASITDAPERDRQLQILVQEVEQLPWAAADMFVARALCGDGHQASRDAGQLVARSLTLVTFAANAELAANTRMQEVRIRFALEIYRREHGAYPDTLAALVPDILAKLPRDLPLVSIKTDTGYRHYGLNGDATAVETPEVE